MRMVNPPAFKAPRGYSNGVLVDDAAATLYVAGQVGWDADERMVSDDFAAQFDRALANVLAVVTEAGGDASSLTRLTIYVTSCDEYVAARARVGEKYRARMGRHYPAMTLVEVRALLESGAKVEIEATAAIRRPGRPDGTREAGRTGRETGA
jgi:enamine deaminase RidA (YjgF/YER057c/UK114 family)